MRVNLLGPRGFFVEHIKPDLYVKFQFKRTYSVRGMAFQKLHLRDL